MSKRVIPYKIKQTWRDPPDSFKISWSDSEYIKTSFDTEGMNDSLKMSLVSKYKKPKALVLISLLHSWSFQVNQKCTFLHFLQWITKNRSNIKGSDACLSHWYLINDHLEVICSNFYRN